MLQVKIEMNQFILDMRSEPEAEGKKIDYRMIFQAHWLIGDSKT